MSCPGCCQGGECVPLFAQLNFACGRNGQSCMQCPVGTNCSPTGTCDPGPPCGPQSCLDGCCLMGSCIRTVLQNEQVCGVGGGMCGGCQPGQQCVSGRCVGGPPTCSPQSCPTGCCENGQCVVGSPFACGVGGGRCQQCAPGSQCVNGSCTQTQCNFATCPGGCCLGNFCVMPSNNNCGSNGQQCVSCGPGRTCQNGACVTPPDAGFCSPATCAGCCRADGLCLQVNQQFPGQCGRGGQFCSSCGPNSTCNAGVCTPTCNPGNCSGCCQNGVCIPRNNQSDFRCGSNGQVCLGCGAGRTCVNGSCVVPTFDGGGQCTPSNCGGCCQNGQCNMGTQNGACGFGGGQCLVCPLGTSCSGGLCMRNPGAPIGSACNVGPDCQTSLCVGWPQGYCTGTCANTMATCSEWAPCPGTCDPGAVCVGAGNALPPFCLASCPGPGTGQSTCRAGYVCDVHGLASITGICRPSCTNQGFGCPGGGTCNQATGYCR